MPTVAKTVTAVPSSGNWAASAGSMIDAVSAIGGEYAVSSSSAGEFYCTPDDFGLVGETINSVTVTARARLAAPGARDLNLGITIGSRYNIAGMLTSTDWADVAATWAVNPSTGSAWTPAEVDAIGRVYSRAVNVSGSAVAHVDYVEVVVDYGSASDVPVSGSVAAESTVAGYVGARLGTSGFVEAVSAVHGVPTVLRSATGSVPIESVVAGTVAYAGGLAVEGRVDITSALSGSPTARIVLSGAVASSVSAAGSPAAARPVSGTVEASTAAQGATQANRPIAGSVAVNSTITGTIELAGSNALTGTISVHSSISGTVRSRQQVSGEAPAASTANGTPGSRQQATGTIPAVSDVTGAPTARYRVDGVVLVVTSITGTVAVSDAETPPTFTLAATLSGDTLTAMLATDHLEVSLT